MGTTQKNRTNEDESRVNHQFSVLGLKFSLPVIDCSSAIALSGSSMFKSFLFCKHSK